MEQRVGESNVFEVLYTCRAMRRLRADPIPPEIIARIVDAAIRAPTGGGTLRSRFVAITDQAVRAEIANVWHKAFVDRRKSFFEPQVEELKASGDLEAARKKEQLIASSQYLADHIHDVPLILFAFGHEDMGPSVLPAVWSACLAARSFGIGSTFTRIVVRDARQDIERILGVPDRSAWVPHAVVPMGYPLGRWGVAPRPTPTAACYANRWGQSVDWDPPADGWWRAEK